MTAIELIPLIDELDRFEMLYIMQHLTTRLVNEEGEPGPAYSIWSPYDAYEAAETLLNVIAESKVNVSE